jgi:hypothetical protein
MRTLRTPAIALLLAGGLTLAGCSNPVEDLIRNGVDNAVDGVTGGDVSIDTGRGADLPAGFPQDLPLPEGNLVASIGADGVYQLTYTLPSEDAATALADRLVAAGYANDGVSDLGEMKLWALRGPQWDIALAMTAVDGVQLSYTVTPAAG